jgi:hypothetical protein
VTGALLFLAYIALHVALFFHWIGMIRYLVGLMVLIVLSLVFLP